MPTETTWSGSLHQTFRLLPADKRPGHLRPFLEGDGKSPDELLATLPYDKARARGADNDGPNPKRYRDGRQVYQTVGLLFEADGYVHVTDLGKATLRWLDLLNEKNRGLLARHAAYGLAACQLRNPTGAGSKYDASMNVFPFAFIWRAMLALGGLSSDELNRGLFRVRNVEELDECIDRIAQARDENDVTIIGDETITGDKKNDRIIPWMSLASFGWTLFPDKGSDGDTYELPTRTASVVSEACRIRHRHRDFTTDRAYVEHISRCAALPQDLR